MKFVQHVLFKQTKILFFTLIVVSFCFCILVFQLITNLNQANLEVRTTNNYKDKNLYILSDSLYDEKETEFFSNMNSMDILKSFSTELSKKQTFDYYNAIWQPIEVSDFKGDIHFDAYYENGFNQPAYNINGLSYRTIKSVQLNKIVFDSNNIQLSEGELFTDTDFIYNDKKKQIPIILGADYRGIYKPGDSFNILYYQRPFEGIVKGVLPPSQKILTKSEPELFLDTYMSILH
ncbi:hypothetical protein [Paenibacillus stellifer]|uniref:hypothetical protein n=1 Tax=Paenibacillus stellifer TaxID=169760 RepID=UPI00068EF5EE|nr:hypothetical protein [Paenibacillus stellifer]